MDTGDLLRILQNIQKDEEELGLQSKLQNLLNFYIENNFDSVNKAKLELYDVLRRSRANNYLPTDYQILLMLDIVDYFGVEAIESTENILSLQAHEVKATLESFISSRQKVLTNIADTIISITNFGLKARVLSDDEFEIGFSFPNEYRDIGKFDNVLKDIKNYLTALADTAGQRRPLIITSVSNGSINIFINACVELAKVFDIALKHALDIYALIKACQDLKKQYQKMEKKRREKMEKLTEEDRNEKVDKIIDKLIKELNLSNEKETNVRILFKSILRHLEQGVIAEVRAPEVVEPVDPGPEANKEDQTLYRKKKELNQLKRDIVQRNKEIFILQQNNFYGENTHFLNSEERLDDE